MPCATVINHTNTNYSFKITLYNNEKVSYRFSDAMQNGSIDFNIIFSSKDDAWAIKQRDRLLEKIYRTFFLKTAGRND